MSDLQRIPEQRTPVKCGGNILLSHSVPAACPLMHGNKKYSKPTF